MAPEIKRDLKLAGLATLPEYVTMKAVQPRLQKAIHFGPQKRTLEELLLHVLV